MHATYNITNDKLRAWFDSRLPEDDYKRARQLGFVYWHGSKCFAAKWSPGAEDFLREMGIESIEQDDRPDDVESRVERFSGYAEKAEAAAESSENYLNERANTERRRENAINGIQKNLELAEHWQERIAGAIRNAQYKERPDVIARRIRGLEADRRRFEREITINDKVKPDTDRQGVTRYWIGHGRGGSWRTQEQIDAAKPWANRWIAHIDRRLEYENACLVAAGGCPEVLRPERKKAIQPKGVQKTRDGGTPEFLGTAGFRGYLARRESPISSWRLIIKVNRTTIEVMDKQATIDGEGKTRTRFFVGKKPIYEIDALKTRQEVQAEMPGLHEDYERLEAIRERIKEQTKAQEVAA